MQPTGEEDMSLREVIGDLDAWTDAGTPAAIATLVAVRRSAPRAPGARLAASREGEMAGSISSGCVESDLVERLKHVIADRSARLIEYGISDEMATGVGLPCGGEIEVLLTPFEPEDPAWVALRDGVSTGDATVLLVDLGEAAGPAEPTGAMLVVRHDGESVGSLGSGALDRDARAAAEPLFDYGGTSVLEAAGRRVFAEAFLPPARLAIVGASPIAEALCHLAAWSGMDVTVIDPRQALVDVNHFPDATQVIDDWPEEGLARAGLDRWLSVVVLSHDEKLDVPALASALRAGCLYIGLLGGGRTQKSRRDALADLGFGPDDLDRIYGPVGLDIGASGPREIALSIMCQLVAIGRGPRS